MDEIIKERMLRNLKAHAASYFYSNIPYDYQLLKDMYLTDPNGCINEDYIGDDLNQSIYNKFYAILITVRDEVGNRDIDIFINVSCDDITVYLMMLGDKVLIKDHMKAWNYWWETDEALMEELYSLYQRVLQRSEKSWPCWNLSMEDIEGVASRNGLSLEGKDIKNIARLTKKGIENALGEWPWDIIVAEAIKNTEPEVGTEDACVPEEEDCGAICSDCYHADNGGNRI